MANDGTIFLDEIGELPIDLQAKLLHVLQDKCFERVGDNRPIEVNVRVIAATNRDMSQAIRKNKFRSDLFYRLNTVEVKLPPLKRKDMRMSPVLFSGSTSSNPGKPTDRPPDIFLRPWKFSAGIIGPVMCVN